MVKEDEDQVRTTAENPESLEAYMQGNDEIGMGMVFSLSLY